MDQVRVVEDVLTDQGWRRIHFLTAKEAVLKEAKEKQLVAVPWESADQIHSLVFEEAGIWHCQLMWPVRGEVVNVPEKGQESLTKDDVIILWTLTGKSERVSEAVEMAAWRYLAWFGDWPDTAWVGKRLATYAGRVVDVEGMQVEILAADWMPELGIGAGRRIDG